MTAVAAPGAGVAIVCVVQQARCTTWAPAMIMLIIGPLLLGWAGDSAFHFVLEAAGASIDQQVAADVTCMGAAALAACAYPPRTTKKGRSRNMGWCMWCLGMFISGAFGLSRYMCGHSAVLLLVVQCCICFAGAVGSIYTLMATSV